MKRQKKLLLFSFVFVFLMIGASVLYNYLGDKVQQDNFMEDDKGAEDLISKEDSNDDVFDDNTLNNADSEDEKSDGETMKEDETSKEDTQKEETPQLKPAKELRVTDIDGNEVALSDFKGKPVVINFWATWCSICKNEMIDFQMMYDQYKDEVEFMMVSVTDNYRETVKKASEYIDKKGYTFPVYYDTLRDAYFIYNISAIPVTYFIDAEGNVVKMLKGGLDRMTLENNISKILPE